MMAVCNMYWFYSSPTQALLLTGAVTFLLALYFNALFLWCLYPVTYFTATKSVSYLLSSEKCCDSAWLLHIYIFYSKLKKYFSFYNPALNLQIENRSSNLVLEIAAVLDLIKKDFISSWLEPVTKDEQCLLHLGNILSEMATNLCSYIENLDTKKTLKACIDLLLNHLKEFQQAQKLYKIQPSFRLKKDRKTEFKKMKSVVDVFNLNFSYHVALKSKQDEREYLSRVLQLCFYQLLDYNMYECHPARELLEKIIASAALEPFIELISEPFWLHSVVIRLTCSANAIPHFADDKDVSKSSQSFQNESVAESIFKKVAIPEQQSALESNFEDNNTKKIIKDHCMPQKIKNTEKIDDQYELNSSRPPIFSLCDDATEESPTEFGDVDVGLDACAHVDMIYEQPSQLITEISIPLTQKIKELYGSNFYVAYNIEYKAWFRKRDGTWHLCSGSIERRYKEFLILRERFEEFPQLQNELKKIKAPGKFVMPFGNMHYDTVEKRKRELEVYLQNLIKVPQLGDSLVLKEFLAYDRDSSSAFVRKPSDVDQMLKSTFKTMTNIIDKLNPLESGSKLPSRETALSDSDTYWNVDPDALSIQCIASEDKSSSGNVQAAVQHSISCFNDMNVIHQLQFEMDNHQYLDALENTRVQSDTLQDGNLLDVECPLASSVLDLALQTLENKECWIKQEPAVLLIKVLLSSFIDAFLSYELKKITTAERCSSYIKHIHETIWPDGILSFKSTTPSDEQKQQLRNIAEQCLSNFFPKFFPLLLTSEVFEFSIDQFMQALDYKIINKHFAFCLCDLLLEHLFPDICSKETQDLLMSSTDKHLQTNNV